MKTSKAKILINLRFIRASYFILVLVLILIN